MDYLGKYYSRKQRNELPRPSSEESRKLEYIWKAIKDESNYDVRAKEKQIVPFLKVLDDEGMIGNVVLDVGAGQRPLSGSLKKEGRKLLTLDFVKPLVRHDFHHLGGDVRNVNHPDSFATRRAQMQVAQWLGVDPRSAKAEQIDTIILSDILNYVPYEETVRSLARYLKPGGLVVILNKPGRTFDGGDFLLDSKGVKSTPEMIQAIEKSGFRMLLFTPLVETKEGKARRFVPVRSVKGMENPDQVMAFAVLRKENFITRTVNNLRNPLQRMDEKE